MMEALVIENDMIRATLVQQAHRRKTNMHATVLADQVPCEHRTSPSRTKVETLPSLAPSVCSSSMVDTLIAWQAKSVWLSRLHGHTQSDKSQSPEASGAATQAAPSPPQTFHPVSTPSKSRKPARSKSMPARKPLRHNQYASVVADRKRGLGASSHGLAKLWASSPPGTAPPSTASGSHHGSCSSLVSALSGHLSSGRLSILRASSGRSPSRSSCA
jgi:hypothetical protein